MTGVEHINCILSSSEVFCFLFSNILKINFFTVAKRFILQLKSVCVCVCVCVCVYVCFPPAKVLRSNFTFIISFSNLVYKGRHCQQSQFSKFLIASFNSKQLLCLRGMLFTTDF